MQACWPDGAEIMDTKLITQGGCHCGAVRLQVEGPLRAPINCHCGLCRRLSGAAFTTWLSVRQADLQIAGEDQLLSYRPTPNLERRFCQHCGGHVLTRDARFADITGLPAGVMDDRAVPPPAGEYFVGHKAPWQVLAPALPCFGGDTGFEPVVASAPGSSAEAMHAVDGVPSAEPAVLAPSR